MQRFIVELIVTMGDDGSLSIERSTMKPMAGEEAPAGAGAVRIKRIRLERSEGVREKQTAEVPDFTSADGILKSWAYSAPKDSHHKVDFLLTFDDGNSFGGEYQLAYPDTNNPDILARHVRAFVRSQTLGDGPDRVKFAHIWETYNLGQGGMA